MTAAGTTLYPITVISPSVAAAAKAVHDHWEDVRDALEKSHPDQYGTLARQAGRIPELVYHARVPVDNLGKVGDPNLPREKEALDACAALQEALKALGA